MGMLNIVDENGRIIGKDSRENIHKKGLLHREVHVWFFTPKGEIIFQLRGRNKDTFPNVLDATVGGHVEFNSDFVDTALKEMLEETGVKAEEKDLRLITSIRDTTKDPVTGKINNVIRSVYAYEYHKDLDSLKVEEKQAQRFEAWSLENLLRGLNDSDKKKFIPSMLEKDYLEIYKKIGELQSRY
jgi:isopentenyldiphosphate isomerase